GLTVSKYCLGTMTFGSSRWRPWVLDERDAAPLLRTAVESGVTFFDTANWYSLGESERIVCKTLFNLLPRRQFILATKTYYPMSDDPNDRGLSRKNILQSVDASLTRMGTDYIDILVIHAFDAATSVEETMSALNDVVRVGKVLYLGASTMFAWQFAEMNHIACRNNWTPFINMQCQYNLLYREEEREMIPYCLKHGIAVTGFSPLARGWLANRKGRRSTDDQYHHQFYGDEVDQAIVASATAIADRRKVSTSQVALAWVNQSSNICCPIIGASSGEQLVDALRALDLTLDADELLNLDALYRPRDVINDYVVNPRPRYARTTA
ncbi:MAG: aldo/keto reductase, partial [Alphaproteobacteria bacterium]|nr:aldo/keto reductase [Alphaproteobacteria bacterium]